MRARGATQASEPLPVEETRQQLEEVLARPEFKWDQQSPIERFFGWLADTFELPDLPGIPAGVQWVLVPLLVLWLIWLAVILRRYLRALAPAPLDEIGPDPRAVADRVRVFLERAGSARTAGDLPLALRLYFFALVVGLGRRGDLEYRDTWTNRELLERGHPTPEVTALLAPLVGDLDRKGFGLAPTSEADVAYVADLCTRWLRFDGGVS